MTQETEYKVDRTGWPSGPWDGEPDKVQWKDAATGLDCMVIRQMRGGHLCGYVGVPQGHPWFEKGYEDVCPDVHGGLTYAERCSGHICHVAAPGEPDDIWWLGFDCMHGGDAAPRDCTNPARIFLEGLDLGGTYRTVEYVRGQCVKLAQQAKEVAR